MVLHDGETTANKVRPCLVIMDTITHVFFTKAVYASQRAHSLVRGPRSVYRLAEMPFLGHCLFLGHQWLSLMMAT